VTIQKRIFDWTKISDKNLKLDRISRKSNQYEINISKFGTFADCKTAPIHRWFQYPAGFSYLAVEYVLKKYNITHKHKVYDPFVGTGTTIVVCKNYGIESWGIEAHPFIAEKIAKVKVKWDYDYSDLKKKIGIFIDIIQKEKGNLSNIDIDSTPTLVKKCYSPKNLKKLLLIKHLIREKVDIEYQPLFNIALIGTLRLASAASTGWPYIAPKKKIEEKDGIKTYINQLNICYKDLAATPKKYRKITSIIINGDCRKTDLEDNTFDFAFTSPPYLNNYDYADRTRLEMYFFDYLKTWKEITKYIRNKLIISATTQISRTKYNVEDIISPELKEIRENLAEEIQKKVNEISKIRPLKGGKKSYDIMVGQYFNDMTLSLKDTYRVLRKGAYYLLILGDSAPYGVHIPTEIYLGEIGIGVGFEKYKIIQMRNRGKKWKNNPQRHHVPLRESLLIFKK